MRVGRYQIHREIARGGMATVHLGRLLSELGVARLVAVKRLHPHCATDPDFVSMFLDEARLAARVRHPNVVPLLDLVARDDDLYMILEYVEGETLAKLVFTATEPRDGRPRIPDRIVAAIMAGALRGLHAAHEAKTEDGRPLGIVHRDFTPQNVLVGTDGIARVADFGVAKAVVRLQTTREGQLKGKLGYMAPEQLGPHAPADRRTDLFSAGVVLWELLARRRLFQGENEGQIVMKILTGAVDPPSDHVRDLDPAWDAIVERALALSPDRRYETARAMAEAIEASFACASTSEVGAWVSATAAPALSARAGWVAEVERMPIAVDVDTTDDSARSAPSSATARSATAPAPAVTAEPNTAAPRRGRAATTVVLAVAALGALGLVAVLRGGAPGAKADEGPTTAPDTETPPAETAAGTAPSASERAAAPTPPDLSAQPAQSAPAAAPRRLPARSPAHGGAAAAPTGAPATAATSKPSCRYFDEQEKIWKFRVECYR